MQRENHTLEGLAERVRKLEHQNRRLRRAGVLILFTFCSVFLMAQVKGTKVAPVKVTKSLEAGKFVLQDGRGKKRAELGLFADRPALVFYDEADNASLSLGLEPDGAGLTLYDSDAQKAAAVTYTSNGPMVTLYNGGRKRLNLSVTAQGPAVGLLGKSSEAKAALGLTADDNPFLHLFGAAERGGAQLLAAPDRTVLRFFDASDKARAVLGIVEKDSAPGLVLNDSAGVARTILMVTADGPGMEFFDQNRVRIWSAR